MLLFHTDQLNRVHHSEEAPRNFTIAPYVVVKRWEGKQRCSRATVSEHAGIQSWEWPRWLFTRNEKSIKKQPNPRNSPSHNHDSAAPRQHTLICTGAGLIHPVHGQPMSLAIMAIPETRLHFRHFCGLFQGITSHGFSTFSSMPRYAC